MQHYTTLEQSEKLMELGLNPETADMYYFCDPTPAGNIMYPTLIVVEKHLHSRLPEYDKGDIPCWSLGALLEVMPKGVQINFNNTGISIDITFVRNGVIIDSHRVKNDTFLEAAYDMVVWLLGNGYIKKGE